MEEKKLPIFPADDAVQNWFEENINKECSASSAIYKFRLWLESLQCKAITSAVWVKASEFNLIENTEYFYKYEYLNKAFKGVAKYEDGMLFSSKTTVLPTGYAELFILDEGTAAGREEDTNALYETKLALRMLLKVFAGTKKSSTQEEWYTKARYILNKHSDITDILRQAYKPKK